MLYSTCTFNKFENEDIIIKLLKENPDLELVDIPKKDGFRPGFTDTEEEREYHLERCARLFPFALDGEGHFVALLKKTGAVPDNYEGFVSPGVYEKGDKIAAETREFLSLIRREFDPSRIRVS